MLLALLLLWTQQWAIAHAITHISRAAEYETESEIESDESLPGEIHCIKCLAFASIGAALATAGFSWPGDAAATWINLASAATDPDCAQQRAFDSRAPPTGV